MNTANQNSFKGDIPVGFGMALSQDLYALNNFAALDITQQKQVVQHAKTIQSREEMQKYVEDLAKGTF